MPSQNQNHEEQQPTPNGVVHHNDDQPRPEPRMSDVPRTLVAGGTNPITGQQLEHHMDKLDRTMTRVMGQR